ncbi:MULTISPECIES: tetratricopeptide repeat protein [Acinetobacter]|uniref:tetratricopeptide repeat protein n=1 Tax=Acinetobacter TaxID=469 RepID=UPI000AF9F353|nr:tetratricopeptide repeat protein [Acinetobacter lwoffii]QGR74146.1 sel1 repeat family protein [Acinetobacter lwoffii]QKT99627.1 sel1 repeat family protein [Acinetobacter lwoffii]TMS40694.1 sel1 repeat family protein [Acinetobacter lwoffii]
MTQRVSPSAALTNLALAGNAEAQFELAELYMQSEHDDDIILAEEWALKAANGGLVDAMYWLGEGYTVYAKELAEEDPEESIAHFELAYYWLSKANIEKHPAATLELAGFYRRGDVIEKDVEKSISLVKQAAEWGEVQAMRDLAFIYATGLGVDGDEELAEFWAQKADAAEQEAK